MRQQELFSNYKYCEYCGNPLSLDFEGNVCPACREQQFFREVKDFIRDNDVTEYDVAKHFNIPLHRVKQWIREGRIEYKQNSDGGKSIATHCKECGAPITFGTLCSKCLKKQSMSGFSTITPNESGRMRYFEDSKK